MGIGFVGGGVGMGTKIKPVVGGGASVGMTLYSPHPHVPRPIFAFPT